MLLCCAAASLALRQPNASRIGGSIGWKLAPGSTANLSPYNSLDAEIIYRLVRMERPRPYGLAATDIANRFTKEPKVTRIGLSLVGSILWMTF